MYTPKANPKEKRFCGPVLCARCHNASWRRRTVVFDHLIAHGFEKGYNVWVRHGEELTNPMDLYDDISDKEDAIDDIDGLLYEKFKDVVA